MTNKPNILIIGHNVKHAEILKHISSNLYILADFSYPNFKKRLSSDFYKFNFIKSNVKSNSLLYLHFKAREIRKIIKNKNIDVVLTNRKDDMIALWIGSHNLKVIKLSTFHNSYAWNNAFKAKILTRIVSLCSDGNIALSSYVYNIIKSNKKLINRVLLLPNTVNYSFYNAKQNYDISYNVKICYVASIQPGKNQMQLINLLNSNFGPYEFQIDFIGEINDTLYKEKIENLDISKNIKLNFVGALDNDIIKSNLCKYDFYISSSLCEMSPYNILEAKCAGLPIIANKVLGHVDLIEDGTDGFLVDFNDIKAFQNVFNQLLNNQELRKKIGQKALLNMKTIESCETYSKIILDFVNKLHK